MKYRTIEISSIKDIKKYIITLDRLDYECFPEDEPYDKVCGNDLHQGSHCWWLTYEVETKKPVAFAGVKRYHSTNNAFFCRAGVLKKHRGKGIHKHLLKKRLNWCKKNKIHYAYSYTAYDSYISANNLIKNGFTLCPPWFDCFDINDFIFLYKKIN